MRDINFADAQQALGFILPQQLRIETEVFQTRYPSFDYAGFMFVDTDGDMWDIGSLFFSGDIAGKAEFLAGKGFDMPYADIAKTSFLRTNQLAGIGYEWSMQELQRAAKMGQNLKSDKAASASKIAEQFIYSIAMAGNTEKNITGLFNDATVPTANVPADGTGSATSFTTKTAALINRDVNEALNAPLIATKETQMANTIAFPTSTLQYLSSTPMGANNDITILKYIQDNNYYTLQTGQRLNIKASRELETAGAGATKRMMAYDNSREVVQFHLPGPHEFLPPFQKSSMTWEIAGIMNIGGTEFRLPKGAVYRDGI
jgi:hypothetical protein